MKKKKQIYFLFCLTSTIYLLVIRKHLFNTPWLKRLYIILFFSSIVVCWTLHFISFSYSFFSSAIVLFIMFDTEANSFSFVRFFFFFVLFWIRFCFVVHWSIQHWYDCLSNASDDLLSFSAFLLFHILLDDGIESFFIFFFFVSFLLLLFSVLLLFIFAACTDYKNSPEKRSFIALKPMLCLLVSIFFSLAFVYVRLFVLFISFFCFSYEKRFVFLIFFILFFMILLLLLLFSTFFFDETKSRFKIR